MKRYHLEHSLPSELAAVHDDMIATYELERVAQADAKRAEKMEMYLREFKRVGNKSGSSTTGYQTSMEAEAMRELAQEVGVALGIGQKRGYSLFGNAHSWYLKEQSAWGADDVFEAEFAKLLELAGQKAAQKKSSIPMGVSLIGGQTANINSAGLEALDGVVDSIVNNSYQLFDEQGQQILNRTYIDSDLIKKPTFRSGKIDATGFNREWVISSEINPKWEGFIRAFTGATFTVKNYGSNSSTETIHLGSSNLYKAIYGTLNGGLGYEPDEAAHIYFHTVYFYDNTKDSNVGSHIIHMRFIYELTGQGLYDSEGNRLDGADFFIYNDPATENIWVRSTKEMIAEIQNYIGNVSDPLHSGIVLLKNKFQLTNGKDFGII